MNTGSPILRANKFGYISHFSERRGKLIMLTNKEFGMKRILITAIVFFACAATATAQQDPQFTQWFNDKQSFNPAANGLQPGNCITGFFRNQWTGFDSQPQTFMLNYTGQINGFGGIGLTFYNDQLLSI